MTKESMQKLILAALVLGGLLYAYFEYAFWPKYIEIEGINNSITQKQEYLQILQIASQDKESLSNKVRTLEEKYEVLRAEIPPVLDKPELIVYFYDLSRRYNLTNGQLQFEDSAREGSYTKLDMTYSASGLVNDLLNFVDTLQKTNNPRITVQSVNVNPGSESARVTLKLTGYAQKLEANPKEKLDFMNSPFGIPMPEGLRP